MELPGLNNFNDAKFNQENDNRASSTASSDFDRLEDYNEAEFRGATLSLSQETSPPVSAVASAGGTSPNVASVEDNANANVDDKNNVRGDANCRRSSSLRQIRENEVHEFFAVREGALQKAAEQCRPVILENLDGNLRGIWLLTEIDHWDTEKERLLFLTDKSLIALKYDFITLRLLDYKRHPLQKFEQIIIGELKYPENSLMPARNMLGVQCGWDQSQPIPALKRWNPWCREIPLITFTYHPLFKMDTAEKDNYDAEDFSKKLIQAIENLSSFTTSGPNSSPGSETAPKILFQPIIIESYAGLVAALHNANDLGFFKTRGKVSF